MNQVDLISDRAPGRGIEVLLIEDNPGDARLIREMLSEIEEPRFCLQRVDNLVDGLDCVSRSQIHVVLLDLSLPESRGIDTFDRFHGRAEEVPVVVLSGMNDETLALQAVQRGAQDYLVKGDVHGKMLARVLRYAVERKQAADSLYESEQKFRELSEHIPGVFWLFDWAEQRVTYVSSAYASVWGRPIEKLYENARDRFQGIHPDDRSRVEESFLRGAATGDFDEEYRIEAPDGSVRWIRDRGYPIRNRQGEVDRIAGVAENVTERKALESQLLQAQKLESIGQLAAGIAHEINTPMQFVGDNTRFLQEGLAELIKPLTKYGELLAAVRDGVATEGLVAEVERTLEESDLDYLLEEIPRAIEQSLEGIERVSKIVRAMKEFSHPGTEEKTPFDLNHAINTTINVARNEWKYVADVATELDASLPPVPVLPGAFNQVILALIVNAAHAIGDVTDEASGKRGTIRIVTRRDGDWAEVRVSDTGGGIPPEVRDRIFEPFFTTKEVGRGTGQGLAIAYSVVVDKHGGRIAFETESGKGTTFIVRLPMDPAGRPVAVTS